MIKQQLSPQSFIERLKLALENETRSPLEIGAKKKPKMEFLKSIIDVIELLFDNLYSVGEQLYLINTVDKKFSLTNTTYFKFINTYLYDEYIILKKNRLFVSKIKLIQEAHDLLPNDIVAQFNTLGDFALKNDLYIEDYENFLNKYFLQENGELLVTKRPLDRYGESTQKYVPSSGNTLKKKTVILKEPDTIKSILPKQKKQKLKNPHSHETGVSSRNVLQTYSNIEARKIIGHGIQEEPPGDNQNKLFHLLPDANVKNIPENIRIVKDVAFFPKEVLGTSFMFSDICGKTNKINENYLYVKDIRYMQWLDLKRIPLKDKLLIIEGKRSTQVFLSYRYYKGCLYLIEESQWNPNEYRIKDELNRDFDKNSSIEVLKFEETLALMEMYPSQNV